MLRPDEIIVDNFAGGGGASQGIFLAAGRHPDIAINHDPEALAMHRANHPTTNHLCEDVFKIDPVSVCGGRPVGLAWFSPDCKHFSKAKGGKPVSKKIRGLAWVAVKWAAAVKPRIICLENVEEFQTWGPVGKDGQPIKGKKGVTFRFWWRKLERLGYRLEMRELRACDYDTPTIRKRLFIIARCDGLPIVWPQATHADPKSEAVKSGRLKAWRTAAECIDWSIPCPSIFERERPLAENTLKRIARGIQRYVIDAADPFIVPVSHAGDSRTHSIDEPMRTVTGAHRGEHALITPYLTEHANASTQRTFPADEPLRTQCGEVKGGHFALVSPVLAGVGGRAGQSRPRSADEPLQTVTAKGDTVVVAPYLVPRYGEREGQEPRCASVESPASTIVPTANGAQLVAAFMAQHNGGPRNENSVGREAEAPLSTITHRGTQQQIVTSNLIKLKGTCKDGQPTDKPMPTIQAGGLHIGDVQAFLIEYYSNGSGKTGASLKNPLPTVPAKDRIGLVMIRDVLYQIVDICMRMLQPRELYRAQGFGDSYIIEYGIDEDGSKITLTKSAQVRMCGNSVCPPLAAAIVRAQLTAEGKNESRPDRPAKQIGLL